MPKIVKGVHLGFLKIQFDAQCLKNWMGTFWRDYKILQVFEKVVEKKEKSKSENFETVS